MELTLEQKQRSYLIHAGLAPLPLSIQAQVKEKTIKYESSIFNSEEDQFDDINRNLLKMIKRGCATPEMYESLEKEGKLKRNDQPPITRYEIGKMCGELRKAHGYQRVNGNNKSIIQRNNRIIKRVNNGEKPVDIAKDMNLQPCYVQKINRQFNPKYTRHKHNGLVGEKHFYSKLTEEKVKEILIASKKPKFSPHDYAKKFGVTYENIVKVVKRQSWKHVVID